MAYPLLPWIQCGIDELGWQVQEGDGICYISGIVPLHVPEHIELHWDDNLVPRHRADTAHPETLLGEAVRPVCPPPPLGWE